MLSTFGTWYLSWGYLVATAIALPAGIWCGGKPKKYLIGFVLLFILLGVIAFYGKHGA